MNKVVKQIFKAINHGNKQQLQDNTLYYNLVNARYDSRKIVRCSFIQMLNKFDIILIHFLFSLVTTILLLLLLPKGKVDFY